MANPSEHLISEQIRQSIESSKVTWRSIESLAIELQLDTTVISEVVYKVNNLAEAVVDGRTVYSTRAHWMQTTHWMERLRASIVGRY